MLIPFTPAIAADMARKSHEARRLNKAKRLDAMAIPTQPMGDAAQLNPYVGLQLTRVRAQISRVNEMIDQEKDAQQLERLARALNVLSERERVLDGRPTPGQLRPAKEPPKRGPARAWVDPI